MTKHICKKINYLKKTFPFIKFNIFESKFIIKIFINSQNTSEILNFSYNRMAKQWCYTLNKYTDNYCKTFNNFLDNFIIYLIKLKLY